MEYCRRRGLLWPGLLPQLSCIQYHLFRALLSPSISGICPFLISLVSLVNGTLICLSAAEIPQLTTNCCHLKELLFNVGSDRLVSKCKLFPPHETSSSKEKERKNRELTATVSVKILWQLSYLTVSFKNLHLFRTIFHTAFGDHEVLIRDST